MKIDTRTAQKYKDQDIQFPYESKEDDNILTMEYNLLLDNIPMNLYHQKRYHFIMYFLDSLNHYDSKAGTGIYNNFLTRGNNYSLKQMVTMYQCICKAEKIKGNN